jgi:hypothetical protein
MDRLATDLADVAKDNQGTLAARPVSTVLNPGIPGQYYKATDTGQLFRDNGTGWDEIALLPIGTADLEDGAVTSAKIADGTIARGDLSFTGVLSSLAGFTKAASGIATIGADTSLLVSHGLGTTAAIVMLTLYGVGLPGQPITPLNYDVPNATQFRVYNDFAGALSFAWLALA